MGLDVNGMIIIGTKVVRREVLETLTKFNEDTGIPYTKEIKKEYWFIEETNSKLNQEEYPEFQVYSNENDDKGLLGICVSLTDLRGMSHLLEVNVKYEPKRAYPFTLRIYNFLSFC